MVNNRIENGSLLVRKSGSRRKMSKVSKKKGKSLEEEVVEKLGQTLRKLDRTPKISHYGHFAYNSERQKCGHTKTVSK